MESIGTIFNLILTRPLFNGLIFLYDLIPDFGLAIILLTLLIRLILYPLNQKAIKSQKALTDLQPKIKELQVKYKGDRAKQSQALMELYKTHNINPASGCLPWLIQLPVLFALYQVFWHGLEPSRLDTLYSFVQRPETISPMFLGLVDLSSPNFILAILAGVFTYIQSKMMMTANPSPSANASGTPDFAATLNKQMVYLMPFMTTFIAWNLPAGLALYWAATTVFGIAQQYLVIRKKNNGTKPATA